MNWKQFRERSAVCGLLAVATISAAEPGARTVADEGTVRVREELPAAIRQQMGRSQPRMAVRPSIGRQAVSPVPLIHWAAVVGDWSLAGSLIDDGTSVDSRESLWGQQTPLHWAALGGDPLTVTYLMVRGADPNAVSSIGETAIHKALEAQDSKFLALQALLVGGTNPNLASQTGWTPLHEAASLKLVRPRQAVFLLLAFGASPRTPENVSAATALHFAALQPYDSYTGDLMIDSAAAGLAADPNARDDNNMTPLHWLVVKLASAADERVAAALIQDGANPTLRGGGRNETAIEMARAVGLDSLADTLQGEYDAVLSNTVSR